MSSKKQAAPTVGMTGSRLALKQAPGDDPAPAEIIERAILDLARGMTTLNASRLKYETIVTLLHANSGVGKPAIRLILNNLAGLEAIFLKPAAKK